MFTIKSYLLPVLSIFAPVKAANILPIVNHVHVIGELKELFIKKAEAPSKPARATKTPTLSYLKAVESGKVALGWYGGKTAKDIIKDYKKEYGVIIDQAIEREKEFCQNYYVFYHGLPNSFHIFQDFLKNLHAFMEIMSKSGEFEFFRMWHEAEMKIDANKYITDELARSGYINDWTPQVAKTLISVNLSLFGNLYNSASHTFEYFKDNLKSNPLFTEELFKRLFKHYGFNSVYIKELMDLNQKHVTKEGRLIQAFIPKDKVDQYVYLSWGGGTPYGTPIDNSIFDTTLGRHTKIAPILDKYIENIESIIDFNNLQGRMLCSQDFMLHPTGGVKIFKYVTIKDKNAQEYQNKLKEISDKIFSEWINSKAYQNIKKTSLGRLLDFMK